MRRMGASSPNRGVYHNHFHLDVAVLGKPSINPPDIVIQDNIKLLAFTVNTDHIYTVWNLPVDYVSGDLTITVEWTNDGGADDEDKWIKAQIDYQTFAEGTSVAGSHANSPKTVEDQYTSAAGWILCISDPMTIAAADFAGMHTITLNLSFVTPAGTILTCDPHLESLEIHYNAFWGRQHGVD